MMTCKTDTIPGLRLTSPPKFLELSGEPSIPFKLWIGLVDDYFYLMECVTGQSMPDRQKNIILRNLWSIISIASGYYLKEGKKVDMQKFVGI